VTFGMQRILWGFFKKLVISERLAILVSTVYNDYQSYPGMYIFIATIAFAFRLYTDFSGCMDIVLGVSECFGIKVPENFNTPFFSRTMQEFWRRWHITLGAWFRDYLFYPVSMSKPVQNISKKCKNLVSSATARLIPSYLALIVVWSATGLWHGGSPNYLLWGWINLFCIVTSMQFKPLYTKAKNRLHISDENRIWQLVQMARTFLIFGFAEMVSDTQSIYGIFMKCKSLIYNRNWQLFFSPLELFPGLEVSDLWILVVGIALMLMIDILKEKGFSIDELVHRIPTVPRYVCYIMLLYSILLFGYIGADAAEGFMYAQF
ncbi:MAG: MBOAT family protein, partial [Clostridiales bacterium]|nr:MBOAT family protein [Clostridiales bacterium]